MYGWEQCKKNMTKMANSTMGYIALTRQLASFCKGRVGDNCRDRSIFIMACMDSRGWGAPTPPIYIYQLSYICSLYSLYAARFGPPQTKFLGTPMQLFLMTPYSVLTEIKVVRNYVINNIELYDQLFKCIVFTPRVSKVGKN